MNSHPGCSNFLPVGGAPAKEPVLVPRPIQRQTQMFSEMGSRATVSNLKSGNPAKNPAHCAFSSCAKVGFGTAGSQYVPSAPNGAMQESTSAWLHAST